MKRTPSPWPAENDDVLLRASERTHPIGRALAQEVALLYYAFVGPFVRRPPREGELAYVESSGVAGVLIAVGLLVIFEGVGVHFLIRSVAAAVWLHVLVDAYALVWLVAAFQAARLRPVVLSPDSLLVRTSLLWTARVPRSAIATVTRIREMPAGRDVLRAAFGTPPEVLVTLRHPIEAWGLMGIRRRVTAIALHVDDADALHAALAPGA